MAQLGYRVMDTQIFNLKLSVHGTSLYIVICSLVGDGLPATRPAVEGRWNGSAEELDAAVRELMIWHVIDRHESAETPGTHRYTPNPASLWHLGGQS